MLKEFAKGCMLWEAAACYANLRAEFQAMVYPVPNTAHSFEMEDVADCLAASAGVSPSLVFTRDYYDMLLEVIKCPCTTDSLSLSLAHTHTHTHTHTES